MCGEKDPFVDDSVIFAGRLREAKRSRQEETRQQRKVANMPFHMSPVLPRAESGSSVKNYTEDELLSQNEDDWVQLEIIEGWSHGYLQMTPIMHEAKEAIEHLGGWMADMFALHQEARNGRGARSGLFLRD